MFVNNVLKSNVFYLKRLFPNDDIMNILFIITMKNWMQTHGNDINKLQFIYEVHVSYAVIQ